MAAVARRTKVGRPSKIMNAGVVDRMVSAIANGCTYEAACAAGPISVRTFYEWMGRADRDRLLADEHSPYLAFAQRVEAANLEAERRITELWVAAIPGDWRAARDFLERRFPHRWRRPELRHETARDHGGYEPPDNFLTDQERAKALLDAINAIVAPAGSDPAGDQTSRPVDGVAQRALAAPTPERSTTC